MRPLNFLVISIFSLTFLMGSSPPSNVTNIALFGIDSSNTEAIMIFSYNKTARKIFLTSIPLDTLISGTDNYQKLSQSYTYGGIPHVIQSINQNFDLNIEKYISLDFKAIEQLIDGIDGVKINIKGNELSELNALLSTQNTSKITTYGPQHLNGSQAITYTRIKINEADYFGQMGRQQKLMASLGKKLKSFSKVKLISLIYDFLPYFETNLSIPDIISVATQLAFGNNEKMIRIQLPSADSVEIRDNTIIPKTLENDVIQWQNQISGLDRSRSIK